MIDNKSELWDLSTDPFVSYRFENYLMENDDLGLLNDHDLDIAEYNYKKNHHISGIQNFLLPPEFLKVKFAMPDDDFAPDYIKQSTYALASARLREAIAQPEDVVQFRSIDLVRGGPASYAQDYREMRVIPRQKTMDLTKSICEVGEITSRITGETIPWARHINQIVMLPDFKPNHDIFRIAESPSMILTKDDLALRVLQAGCTGIEFRDPLDNTWGKHIKHIRTATGVADRPIGF